MGLITRTISVGIILLFLFNGCALLDQFFGEEEDEMSPGELMSEAGMVRHLLTQ